PRVSRRAGRDGVSEHRLSPGQEPADLVAARPARAGRRRAMTRLHVREVAALVAGDELRAPAPGWFRRTIEPDHLVAAGDAIGELEVLGRLARVIAPHVRGIAKLPSLDVRRAVAYGDVLVRLTADVALAPSDPAAAPDAAAAALVFRAPTS